MITCHYSGEKDTDKCDGKQSYGCYCYKHRRVHLLENDMICPKRYTGKSGDYLKSDLQKYGYIHISKDPHIFKTKKPEIFKLVDEYLKCNLKYQNDIHRIKVIQELYRKKLEKKSISERDCNNTEDFYTYDKISEIEPMYFYSYIDEKGFRWGFDIRSLHRLIQLNYPNPYTTEKIPENNISEITNRLVKLEGDPNFKQISAFVYKDRTQMVKQMVVDLFSLVEQSGYTCRVEWFLNLSLRRLREFYKQLEDIWNYRAQLTHQMKRIICPPDGRIFTVRATTIMTYQNKEDIQELILKDVNKFRNGSEANMKLGFMYFMIGFGYVSLDCYVAHQDWLNLVGY
jgi:hypothetical protein